MEDFLSAKIIDHLNPEEKVANRHPLHFARASTNVFNWPSRARSLASASRKSTSLCGKQLSPWALSIGKRFFDYSCVLAVMPLLIPALLVIALAVRLTSSGPILFLQKRMGRHGREFTILKFRTMMHVTEKKHNAVTTACNQRFTSIGPFLRRFKLDELPQLLNVLIGHMSLVGPRPKMLQHVMFDLPCRPGITGAATIAFAKEESALERVPKNCLDDFYHGVVLPAKRRMDARYMSRATFFSDLKLIVNSVLRRWNSSVLDRLIDAAEFDAEERTPIPKEAVVSAPSISTAHVPMPPGRDRSVPAEQVATY